MTPKDPIDQWITQLAPGKSFVDIGGLGSDAGNQRVITAARAGASRYTMADIRPRDYWAWDVFRRKCDEADVEDVREVGGVDIRKRETLAPIGICDIVHSTGILYHVQSPAEALWNLRSITGQYLITNTVTFPNRVENEHGVVELPDHGILFTAALSPQQRLVLNEHYHKKFGWTMENIAPQAADARENRWIENGELTCWPSWYYYSDHAFRSLLALCRLNIVQEWKWEDHSLQVLCEVAK